MLPSSVSRTTLMVMLWAIVGNLRQVRAEHCASLCEHIPDADEMYDCLNEHCNFDKKSTSKIFNKIISKILSDAVDRNQESSGDEGDTKTSQPTKVFTPLTSLDKTSTLSEFNPSSPERHRRFPSGYVRIGRAHPAGYVRIGKAAPAGYVRLGKAAPYGYVRIGKAAPAGYVRLGKAAPYGYVRIGKAAPYGYVRIGKAAPYGYVRIGKAAPAGYVRLGKAAPYGYVRIGKAAPYGYVRIGKAVPAGYVRLGKAAPSAYVRLGKRDVETKVTDTGSMDKIHETDSGLDKMATLHSGTNV